MDSAPPLLTFLVMVVSGSRPSFWTLRDRAIFQERMANDLKQIELALAPHRDETIGVVVESTFNWYWLVDGLMDAGYRAELLLRY